LSQTRTAADLDFHAGPYRSFEWYWDAGDEMPGLDAYEQLTADEQERVVAAFRHWGSVAPGDHPLKSRVNVENERPTIVAVKAGQHRFLAFRSKSADWIVAGYYRKKSEKREKTGDREVDRVKRALNSYEARVEEGVYYERK
jgi:hypothetical protein